MASVPSGITEHDWRKFQAKKARAAEMKSNVESAMSSSSSSGAKSRTNSSSLDSAALQGDMARRYNLGPAPIQRRQSKGVEGGGRGVSRSQAKPASAVAILRQQERHNKAAYKEYRQEQEQATARSSVFAHAPIQAAPAAPLPDIRCASCRAMNHSAGPVCTSCGYFLMSAAGFAVPFAKETLAQRRGLVPATPDLCIPAITPLEWTIMEKDLQKRKDAFCPICMEAFNQGREVLLSCSHMFHYACLQAFEKFMARDARTCPICRSGNYQKKLTHVGSHAFQKLCVVRVQRLYRGYCARKVYRIELKSFYKLGAGAGSAARRRFFEKELSLLGNRIAKETDARMRGLNSVVQGIDRTLNDGRELDLLFDAMLQQRQDSQMEIRANARLIPGGSGAWAEEALPTGNDDEENEYALHVGEDIEDSESIASEQPPSVCLTDIEWMRLIVAAQARGLGECAICMAPNKGFRHICLLSCSHLFHTQCIVNFEKFVAGSKNTGCPVCRSAFIHRGITTGFELIGDDMEVNTVSEL